MKLLMVICPEERRDQITALSELGRPGGEKWL